MKNLVCLLITMGLMLVIAQKPVAQVDTLGKNQDCSCQCLKIGIYKSGNNYTILDEVYSELKANKWYFIYGKKESRDTFKYDNNPGAINEYAIVLQEDLNVRALTNKPVKTLPLEFSKGPLCEIYDVSYEYWVYGDGDKVEHDHETYWKTTLKKEPGYTFLGSAKTQDRDSGYVRIVMEMTFRMHDTSKDSIDEKCLSSKIVVQHTTHHFWNQKAKKAHWTPPNSVDATIISTGNTIDEIFYGVFKNNSDEPVTFITPPFFVARMYIVEDGQIVDSVQIYIATESHTVSLSPGQDTTIFFNGACVDPYTMPIPSGDTIPLEKLIDLSETPKITPETDLTSWPGYKPISSLPEDSLFVTLPDGTPIMGSVDLINFPELYGGLIKDIIQNIDIGVDSLVATETIPENPYSNNPIKLTEALKSQIIAIVITRLTNPENPYTENHFTVILEGQYRKNSGVEISMATVEVQEAFGSGRTQIFDAIEWSGPKIKAFQSGLTLISDEINENVH